MITGALKWGNALQISKQDDKFCFCSNQNIMFTYKI